jgi:hypothetical protein
VLFDALTSSLQNNNQQQQKQMQNKVELELVKERQEQFFELEKGSLKNFF